MEYRLYGDLKNEVEVQTDTEAEDFVSEPELRAYFQDAVREAGACIHKLGLEDDYFLAELDPKADLTNGQKTLDLPADIYANKLRGLIYATPSKVYPIKRIKGPKRFEIIQNLIQNPTSGDYYRYQILNLSGLVKPVIAIYPYSYEATAACISMTYIRNVFKIVDDNSPIDVPEFYSFVKAFVQYKVHFKEGSPMLPESLADLNKERQLMLDTLAEMVPDYDSEIVGDLSIYEEHS